MEEKVILFELSFLYNFALNLRIQVVEKKPYYLRYPFFTNFGLYILKNKQIVTNFNFGFGALIRVFTSNPDSTIHRSLLDNNTRIRITDSELFIHIMPCSCPTYIFFVTAYHMCIISYIKDTYCITGPFAVRDSQESRKKVIFFSGPALTPTPPPT